MAAVNQELETEVDHLKFQLEKTKADFQTELKEIRFQVYSEEVRKYSELVSHLEIRLRSYEERRLAEGETAREESDARWIKSDAEALQNCF